MANTEPIEVSPKEERLVFAMQMLGDKTRFKMFKLLSENANQKLCVSDIAENLGISVSAVSQHFKNFEMTGLVDKKRTGQKICYVLKDDGVVKDIRDIVDKNR